MEQEANAVYVCYDALLARRYAIDTNHQNLFLREATDEAAFFFGIEKKPQCTVNSKGINLLCFVFRCSQLGKE